MCRVSLLGPDSYLSSLLADIHYSFVFLFHCNRSNFMTVERYDQNYFFFTDSVLVSFTYISVLIYVCCYFQFMYASVNVTANQLPDWQLSYQAICCSADGTV